jgi:spore maturation protein A
MLNYIWAGLIITSLLFALATDVRELVTDRFRNEAPVPVRLVFPDGFSPEARRQRVVVRLDSVAYRRHYGAEVPAPDTAYAGMLIQTREGRQVTFGTAETLPEPLATVRTFAGDDEADPLRGTVAGSLPGLSAGSRAVTTGLRFAPVRFRKLNDVARAALDFAETAASLALGFIGVLALMLGLLKIGEEAGLVHALTRAVQPVLRPLFPEIPEGHPAMGTIALNLLANVFALGNAATPLGIKAMEEMQELNPEKDTATNSMVMLLALNTSSVQLVPPVLLVAIMGLQINQLVFSIALATLFSTIAGILAALGLGRLRRFQASNPLRNVE